MAQGVISIDDTNILTPVLYVLTAGAGFTVMQRLAIVWMETKGLVDEDHPAT